MSSFYCKFPDCLSCLSNCTCCCCQHAHKCGCVSPTTCYKLTAQCGPCDCRGAFPGDSEVPCALSLLGCRCCGSKGVLSPGAMNRVDPKDLCLTTACLCQHCSLYCKCPECIGFDCQSTNCCCHSGCSEKVVCCSACKCISTTCGNDCRCAIPCDDDVPAACAICGLFLFGKRVRGTESVPMLAVLAPPQHGAATAAPVAMAMRRTAPPAITLPQLTAFYAANDPGKSQAEIAQVLQDWDSSEHIAEALQIKYADDVLRYAAQPKEGDEGGAAAWAAATDHTARNMAIIQSEGPADSNSTHEDDGKPCSGCGAPLAADAAFCTTCGANRAQGQSIAATPKFDPNTGQPIAAPCSSCGSPSTGAPFCANCGTKA